MNTTLFVFFTNSPRKVVSLSPQNAWIDKARELVGIPNAKVVLIEHTEWDAPILLGQNPAEWLGEQWTTAVNTEIQKIRPTIVSAMAKTLLEHGVPQAELGKLTGEFGVLPIQATMRAVFIVSYQHN